jgi:hypothetical protein
MRRLVAAALALGALAACGGDDDTGVIAPTVVTLPSTTATTARTAPPTTGGPLIPQSPAADPGTAANALIAAWRDGNQLAALTIADQPAVDVLFAIPVEAPQARGCNQGGADPTYCVYRLQAGELQLRVGRRASGWIVVGAILGT